MSPPADPFWEVYTDYALGRWLRSRPPPPEQLHAAFEWVVDRILGGPSTGPDVVAHNGDGRYQTVRLKAARLVLLVEVYRPNRSISVLQFDAY